jgi:hypothetical protein
MHFCIKQPITPTAAEFNHAHPRIVESARQLGRLVNAMAVMGSLYRIGKETITV